MDRRAQPWLVPALVVLVAAVPYFRPALANYRIASPAQLRRIFLAPFQGRPAVPVWEPLVNLESPPEPVPTKAAGTASAQAEATLPEARETQAGPVFTGPLLEDPTDSLRAFHAALLRSEQGQHVVRISHFGDSPITGDLISGEARQRFQRLYGDAGHGWILPGRPWEWYGHLGVTLDDEGWTIHSPAAACSRDRAYGFGGASFSTRGVATTRLTTTKHTPFQRLELHYLAQPKGGSLQLKVDGEVSTLSTQRAAVGPAAEVIELKEDATHAVTLRTLGDGEVTLYGLVLERSAHGVVYDALGANGGAIRHLSLMDEANWIPALKLRRPDLVILAFGTNESGYVNVPGPTYEQDYRKVIARLREALPGVAILIMAPMDRAERSPSGEIVTMPSIPRLVAAQRKLALATGCAFFNTYQAMGGEGSALRWYKVSPRLMAGDFTHPSRSGADRVAKVLVESLRGPEAPKAAVLANPELKGTEGKP
jgi:lysophospholipase L1-like esterase